MTYPQYQQPAYPAQPQQYGAPSYPGGYPMPPQLAYPQGTPPAAAPMPMPPAQGAGIPTPPPPMPTLKDGGTNGGGSAAPSGRHLVGRTVIVLPHRVDDTKINTDKASDNYGKPQPEAYFDLVVIDGGPLQYGDNQSRNPQERRPNTHEIDTPCVFRNTSSNRFGFVQAVREALDAGEAGRVGVVQQGTRGNFPYLITKCGVDVEGNERPDGEARFAAAMEIFGKLWADKHAPAGAPRQFVNPTPRSLVAPPPAGPGAYAQPAVNYGQPQPAAAPAQPGAYAAAAQLPAGYAVAGMEHYGQAGYPQANVAPTGPGGMYMPGAAAPAQPAPPAVSAPPAAAAAQVPPQIEAWLATLPPELAAQQRAAYLANAAPQPAATAPAATGPGM